MPELFMNYGIMPSIFLVFFHDYGKNTLKM
jgi:hypothetical protein